MDYKKFNELFNVKDLAEEVKNLEENGGTEFDSVPVGQYEVSIQKLELTQSKKDGSPMVSVWMKVLEGDFKNQLIFFNQVIVKPYSIHVANEFLRSLGTDIEVKFESFEQYANMLADIYERIDGKLEYGISYFEDSKGYKRISIDEVFEV